MSEEVRRSDLVFPDLSYKVVGSLYDVYNELGYGHPEKTYQRALALAFKSRSIIFEEQLFVPVSYKGEKVANQYFDFLVEGKIIVELKKGDHFSKKHIDQLFQYLVSTRLKLGILAYFTPKSVHYKRIVNI